MEYTACNICGEIKPCSVAYWYEDNHRRRQRAICRQCSDLD